MRANQRQSAIGICVSVVALIALAQWAPSAADGQPATEHAPAMAAAPTKAICVIDALGDSKVAGKVTFTKKADGIEIEAEITGLTEGKHGFHVHEFGDCSMMDGKCAGAHFNPEGKPHAGPDDPNRHAGDFGNLEADSSGKAHLELKSNMLKFSGEGSILGHAVIVHEKVDDYSQPVGNAGGRVACGVIGVAKP